VLACNAVPNTLGTLLSISTRMIAPLAFFAGHELNPAPARSMARVLATPYARALACALAAVDVLASSRKARRDSVQLQEVREQIVSMLGQDRFGVKLHAFDG
jgi:hypothetical protein